MTSNGDWMRAIVMQSMFKFTLATVAALIISLASAQTPPLTPPAAPVSVVVVEPHDVPVYANGIGTVAADQLVQVKARVDGVIEQIGFTEGADVKQGDFLVQLDPRPYRAALDQALAKKASDQAALLNAQKDQKRDVSLLRTQDVSQQTLDTQGALVAQTQAAVAGDQAAVASARLNLEYTRITAPIAGHVGLRQVDVGNLIQAAGNQPLVSIAAIHPISVIFTLPQDRMPAIIPLLSAAKPALAIATSADNRTELARGHLVTADNQIDSTTGTIKLKASFDNPDNHLWPGQFVNVKLLTATLPKVLFVPSSAVQRSPDGVFVFVVGADSKASVRPVSLGPDDGNIAVISKGVVAGERVVVGGASRVSAGGLVSILADSGDQGAAR
jgi:multidrug efflux system membrane fusion protein